MPYMRGYITPPYFVTFHISAQGYAYQGNEEGVCDTVTFIITHIEPYMAHSKVIKQPHDSHMIASRRAATMEAEFPRTSQKGHNIIVYYSSIINLLHWFFLEKVASSSFQILILVWRLAVWLKSSYSEESTAVCFVKGSWFILHSNEKSQTTMSDMIWVPVYQVTSKCQRLEKPNTVYIIELCM